MFAFCCNQKKHSISSHLKKKKSGSPEHVEILPIPVHVLGSVVRIKRSQMKKVCPDKLISNNLKLKQQNYKIYSYDLLENIKYYFKVTKIWYVPCHRHFKLSMKQHSWFVPPRKWRTGIDCCFGHQIQSEVNLVQTVICEKDHKKST